MQRTNFDYEIVIGEDRSIDSTRDIVSKYKSKYPDKIRLVLREKNIGMIANSIETLKECTGQYIALLDGDDYWLSPDKLQKQVNFLDKNSDFAMCFHPVEKKKEFNGQGFKESYGWGPSKKNVYNVEDLIRYDNFIPTSSVVRRREITDLIPDWFLKLPYSDWATNILCAKFGKIRGIKEVLGVYRSHSDGIWGGLSKADKLKRRIECYKTVGKKFELEKYSFYREALGKLLFALGREIDNEQNPKGQEVQL